MTGVLQGGNVTPGHVATWATDGVIQDGGPLAASQKVLASIRGANFNTTTDQALLIPPAITAFQLTGIVVTNASISLTTAAGGFYPAVAKGGTPIVANTQVYSALSSSDKLLQATLASFGSTTRFSASNLGYSLVLGYNYLTIYLSLTTAQGAIATADVYAVGIDLS
jgi:hypothetical protein